MEIKARAQACLNNCESCFEQAQQFAHPAQNTIETQLERLRSWTSNINVLDSYKASLDYRLRKTQEVEQLVISILTVVQRRSQVALNSLGKPCTICVSEGRACDRQRASCRQCSAASAVCQYDDQKGSTDRGFLDNVTASFDTITKEITILHQLSNTIRRATRDVRNAEVDESFPLRDEYQRDISGNLEKMFGELIDLKLPCIKDDIEIRNRFLTSMMIRRRRMAYRRKKRGTHEEPALTDSSTEQSASASQLQTHPMGNPGGSPGLKKGKSPLQKLSIGDSVNKIQVANPTPLAGFKGSRVSAATTLTPSKLLTPSKPSLAASTSGRTIAQSALESLPFPPQPRMYNRKRYNKLKSEIVLNHQRRIRELKDAEVMHLREGRFDKGVDIKLSVTAENKKYRDERLKIKRKCEKTDGTCPVCLCLFEREMFTSGTKWSHPSLEFDSADEYEQHMKDNHEGTFEDHQLASLTESNAWANEALYEHCPLCNCKEEDIKGSVIEHIIDHLRYLALRSVPDMDDRSELSSVDSSASSGTRRTQTTIRETRAWLQSPLSTAPLLTRPDDDLIYEEDPYVDWNGYDEFITLFPQGIRRSIAGKGVTIFPFPLEPSLHNLDEHEYPSSWPADPSATFTRPDPPEFDGRDYEWSFVWNYDLADRIVREMDKHELGLEKSLRYLPDSSLDLLITEQSVVATLKDNATADLVKFILEDARKVFTITLLSVQDLDLRAEALKMFRNHGLTDEFMPIPLLTRRAPALCGRVGTSDLGCTEACGEPMSNLCYHSVPCAAFHHDIWEQPLFEQFFSNQWHFHVPLLDSSIFIYEFEPDIILPLASYHREHLEWSGHFSHVIRAKMLQRCQTSILENAWPDEQGEMWIDVALKTMKAHPDGWDVETVWRREAEALRATHKLHSHLMCGIAAFCQKNRYYLLTEWASGGNLREFWERNPSPQLSHNLILTVLTELGGLADALKTLHYIGAPQGRDSLQKNILQDSTELTPSIVVADLAQQDLQTSSEDEHERHDSFRADNRPDFLVPKSINQQKGWLHGDIKPENILVLLRSGNEEQIRTLKLGDFGTAKRIHFETSLRIEQDEWSTPSYESPESYTQKGPKSPSSDVWSFGCVIYEFVLWLLYGTEGVNRFQSPRGENPYWSPSGIRREASISENFREWTTYILKNDPECTADSGSAIRSLVELVRDECLVIERHGPFDAFMPVQRANMSRLSEILGQIIDHARTDKSYCSTGADRVDFKPLYSALDTRPSTPQIQTTVRKLDSYKNSLDREWTVMDDHDFARAIIQRPEIATSSFSTPPDSLGLCSACLQLNLETPFSRLRRRVEDIEQNAQAGCQLCVLLREAVFATNLKPPEGELVEFYRTKSGLWLQGSEADAPDALRVVRRRAVESSARGFIPIGLPRLCDAGSGGHLAIIGEWLRDCDKNHSLCQADSFSIKPGFLPTRIVDVGTDDSLCRLIDTAQYEAMQYVAVSHTWGEGPHFICSRKNIDRLRYGIALGELPRTLRDALTLARRLGLRYLWIDALCVIFDSPEDLKVEIEKMEDIFNGAYCVFAGTSAESMASGFLRPRQEAKVVILRGPEGANDSGNFIYVSNLVDDFEGDVLRTRLHTRAWALQERILARRTIFFAKNQTYFECGNGIRCETLTSLYNAQQSILGDAHFPQNIMSSGGLVLSIIQSLFQTYSGMALSLPTDKPIAIMGLEKRLASALQSRSFAGVLEKYWGRLLLWVSAVEQSLEIINFAHSSNSVPSWSWMAYQGEIKFLDTPIGNVEWNSEIRLPYEDDAISSRGERSPVRFTTTVYEISNLSPNISEGTIYYDRRGPRKEDLRCFVIGTVRGGGSVDSTYSYYVIVVDVIKGGSSLPTCRRAGVGIFSPRQILWQSSELAHIE